MFKLEMKTDNAAFDGMMLWQEIARILRDTANYLEQQEPRNGTLRDSNGNRVGTFTVTRA